MKIGVFYRVVLLVHLPKENPFRIVGGCKICDNTGALAITTRIADTKGRCETMCPNRDLIGTNQCTFRECPAGFFADTSDKCYPCDSALDVESDTDRCTCLNRTLKDGKCILLY